MGRGEQARGSPNLSRGCTSPPHAALCVFSRGRGEGAGTQPARWRPSEREGCGGARGQNCAGRCRPDRRGVMSTQFAAAVATGDPVSLAARCVAGIPAIEGANLGILYLSEPAAPAFPQLVRALTERTAIRSWGGGVGLGICSAQDESFDEPAAVAMT